MEGKCKARCEGPAVEVDRPLRRGVASVERACRSYYELPSTTFFSHFGKSNVAYSSRTAASRREETKRGGHEHRMPQPARPRDATKARDSVKPSECA